MRDAFIHVACRRMHPAVAFEKIVSAGSRNQHVIRVRSPEYANAREAIRRVVAGIVRARIRG